MCKPVEIDRVSGSRIIPNLILQTSKAMGCLGMEPEFTLSEMEEDEQIRLQDIEKNAKHCIEHLNIVFQLLLKLQAEVKHDKK